ncbi:MAG: hypothetical protein COA42_19530 [Alteromonadaceae bacterium]|nr:MAG: hypothetical protein COA42_19530 [Alteromonadaceae bacterium]
MGTTDYNAQLHTLHQKHAILEQLVTHAKNIHEQSCNVSDTLTLIKPSQVIPTRTRKQLTSLAASQQKYSDEALRIRQAKVDKLIQDNVKHTMRLVEQLSEINTDDILEQQLEQIRAADVAYGKRTKLALAIRIALQDRGLVTPRLHVSLDQDYLNEKIEDLCKQEHQCREKIHQQIDEVIDDCKAMLKLPKLPMQLREVLQHTEILMHKNLICLDEGKPINGLNVEIDFEVIDVKIATFSNPDIDLAPVEKAPPKQAEPKQPPPLEDSNCTANSDKDTKANIDTNNEELPASSSWIVRLIQRIKGIIPR